MEDNDHYVIKCRYVAEERERMERLQGNRVEGGSELDDSKKVAMVMCRNEAGTKAMERI